MAWGLFDKDILIEIWWYYAVVPKQSLFMILLCSLLASWHVVWFTPKPEVEKVVKSQQGFNSGSFWFLFCEKRTSF